MPRQLAADASAKDALARSVARFTFFASATPLPCYASRLRRHERAFAAAADATQRAMLMAAAARAAAAMLLRAACFC